MALVGEITVGIKLEGLSKFKKSLKEVNNSFKDGKKAALDFEKSLKSFTTTTRSIGREMTQLGRTIRNTGLAITGAFAAAFAKASKEIPAVSNELKKLENSFQEIANAIAIAALPTLREFSEMVSQVAAKIKQMSAENQAFLNGLLKFGGLAVVFGTIVVLLGTVLKSLASILTLLKKIGLLNPTFIKFGLIIGGILLTIRGLQKILPGVIKDFKDWVSTESPMERLSKFVQKIKENMGDILMFFAQLGNPIQAVVGLFTKMGVKAGKAIAQEDLGIGADKKDLLPKETVERSLNNLDRFVRGFRSGLKSAGEAMEEFGASVAQSLESSLGDAIFDGITTRFKNLKEIIKAFATDVLKQFSRLAANQLMGSIFGTGDQKPTLLGAAGGFLGRGFGGTRFGGPGGGGGGSTEQATESMRALNEQVKGTTKNFGNLQVQKDLAIGKLQQFGQMVLQAAQGLLQSFATLGQGVIATVQTMLQAAVQFGEGIIKILQAIASQSGGGGGGGLSGLFSIGGAILGSIIPGIGTAIGGAIGGAVGSLIGGGGIGGALQSIAPAIGGLAGGFFGGGGGLAPGEQFVGSGGQFISKPSLGVDVPGLAEGGLVRKPTLALAGESGPEAVVPLDQMGGMGGINVSINADFVFADDNAAVDRFVRKITDGIKRASGRRTGGTAIAF